MDKIRIGSFNVNGIREGFKRRQIFRYLHEKKLDVVCLQETHCTHDVEKVWKTEWGGRIIFNNGTSQSKGVCVLFKKKLNVQVHFIHGDSEGRFLVLDVSLNNKKYTLTTIYAPNMDSPLFFQELIERVELLENPIRIWTGDFNFPMLEGLDKQNGIWTTYEKSKELLLNYFEETRMVDIW